MSEALKVGDRVTWCYVTRSGRTGIVLSSKCGKIVALCLEATVAQVRRSNGRMIFLPVNRLRAECQKTEVSGIFEEIAKRATASSNPIPQSK